MKDETHVSEGAAKTPGQATHTPEPWNYVKDDDDDHLIMAGDQVVIRSNGNFSWDDGLRKDMTRAAACVNALEGIANPAAVKQLVEAAKVVATGGMNYPTRFFDLNRALVALDTPVSQKRGGDFLNTLKTTASNSPGIQATRKEK